MPDLFPAIPEDLAAAETDELRGLLDEFLKVGLALRANEADLGDLTPEQVKEQLAAAVESKKAIEAELAGRVEAEENYVADITELTAELGVEDAEEGSEESTEALEVEDAEALSVEAVAKSEGDGDD